MPAVPAAIAAWAATAGTIGVIKAVVYSAMVINGLVQARRQRRAARAAYEASLSDRALVVRSAEAPRSIIYGRTRGSGPLVYAASSGAYKENLHLVIALAGHELDSIEDVWFNDSSIGALDANGWVTGGRYVKTAQKSATAASLSLPSSRQIVLPHTPDSISTVSVDTGTDNGYETVAYTLSGTTVTVTDPAHEGKLVRVTYIYTEVTPLVRVKRFLGIAAGERDEDLETATAGEWTSAHVGKGVPRLHVTLVYDPDVFPSGIPNISAIVRGKKVYDPRTTTTAWSRNAALIARDYLTSDLGFAEDPASINDALVVTAANISDELVPGYEIVAGVKTSTNLPRYTVDGALGTDADRIENLGMVLGAMVGTAAYSGDKWLVRAGAYVTPTLDLTADDLGNGPIEVVSALPRRELFNAVSGRFIDPAQGYQAVDFPPYFSSTYAALDGGEEMARDIVLPLTDNASVAQRVAKLLLHRARQALTISATWKLKAYPLQPGDTCRLTIEHFGWTNKVFRVVERRLQQPGVVQLVLQEEAAAVYAWDFSEDGTPDPAPNTSLLGPGAVAALANVVLSSGAPLYRKLSDGTQQPIIRATWDAVTDIAVRQGGGIEIWIKRANEDEPTPYIRLPGDATGVDIAPVARDETYLVQLRAVNALGVHGPWTLITHTVSSGAITNSSGPQVSQIYLTASSSIFRVDAGGAPTPASITLTLETQDTGAPVTWSIVTGTATLAGSGLTRTLAYADAGSDIITVMAEQGPQKTLLTIVKVYDGVDGSPGSPGPVGTSVAELNVYLRAATAPATPTGGSFSFATQVVTPPSGWSASIPTGADPVWVSRGVAVTNTVGGTDTPDWGAPAQVFADGQSVDAIYRRSATQPSTPGASAGVPSGWYTDIASLPPGSDPIWTAFGRRASPTANWVWQVPVRIEGIDGDPGANGKVLYLTASSQVFQVAKSGAATPASITFTAIAQNLTGAPTFTVTAGSATLTGTGSTRSLAFANLATDTATVQVTQDGLTDTITVAKVREGSDSLTIVTSNSSHTVPASAAGVVSSYAGSGTTIQVYEGSTPLTYHTTLAPGRFTAATPTVSPASSITTGARTGSGTTTLTVADHSAMSSAVDVVTISYPLTVRRLDGTDVSMTVVQTLAKAKQGSTGDPGAAASSIRLAATSQVFQVAKSGTATPASITLTLTAQNLLGGATWSATNSATLTGTGSSRTLTYANLPGDSTTVTVSQGGYSDQITIVKVREGSDAVVSLLTNESHVVPAANDGSGADLTNANTFMKVFVGTVDDTANWSFSRTNGLGVTSTITTSGSDKGKLTVSALSVDASYVDITATRAGYPAQTKRFSISKAKAGTAGNPGERGSLTGYGQRYGISSSAWSDGIANRVINNMLTGASLTTSLATTSHLRIGDTVTLSNASSFAEMRYWGGTSWLTPGLVLDGNLLVGGTVSATAMAANSVTATNGAIANLTVSTLKILGDAVNVITSGRATWTRYDGELQVPDPGNGDGF